MGIPFVVMDEEDNGCAAYTALSAGREYHMEIESEDMRPDELLDLLARLMPAGTRGSQQRCLALVDGPEEVEEVEALLDEDERWTSQVIHSDFPQEVRKDMLLQGLCGDEASILVLDSSLLHEAANLAAGGVNVNKFFLCVRFEFPDDQTAHSQDGSAIRQLLQPQGLVVNMITSGEEWEALRGVETPARPIPELPGDLSRFLSLAQTI